MSNHEEYIDVKDAEVREGYPRQKANHEQPHEGKKQAWGPQAAQGYLSRGTRAGRGAGELGNGWVKQGLISPAVGCPSALTVPSCMFLPSLPEGILWLLELAGPFYRADQSVR